MSYSKFIARLVTERRGLVWLAVALIAALSLYVLVTRLTLDTEVLNLLPGKFESVQGLKVYNRDFAQTRELTFALVCQPNDVDKLEEFAPIFAERLRQQPWNTRVLGGSPMESPEGIHDLQGIAVPLLLNLEPQAFAETIAVLQPDKLQARLARLHQEIEAGSPRPEFELQLDPLGVVAPALKPFAGNAALEQDQPLTSPDRHHAHLSRGHQPTVDQRLRLPGVDEKSERLPRPGERGLGRRAARGSGDGALGLRRGNFAQHAPRHRRHAARLDPARRRRFLCRLSPLAAAARNGLFASPLLPRRARRRAAHFPRAQHGHDRDVRDPDRAGRGFRDPDFRPLPTGAKRRSRPRPGDRGSGREPWPRDFLWRPHDRGRLSRAAPRRLGRLHPAGRAHRDRHPRGRSFHDERFLPLHPGTFASAAARLDSRPR